jgi:hypothetical protein
MNQTQPGNKYIAIVFFSDINSNPRKYSNWINDYTLSKNQFQNFCRKKLNGASYINLYHKENNHFFKQIKL